MIARGDRVIVRGEGGVVLAGGGWTVPVRFDGDGPPELRVRFVDARDILREETQPQPDATPDRTKPAQDLQGEIERLTSALYAAEAKAMQAAMERDKANAELREARRTMGAQTAMLDAIGTLIAPRFITG